MKINNKEPFVGLAFKLEETQYGQLTWIRVYQGRVKKGAIILNTSTGKKAKVSRMCRMHSEDIEDVFHIENQWTHSDYMTIKRFQFLTNST